MPILEYKDDEAKQLISKAFSNIGLINDVNFTYTAKILFNELSQLINITAIPKENIDKNVTEPENWPKLRKFNLEEE